MPHRINRECAHIDCANCDMADPALCKDWAEMTAEHHSVRYCKYCDEPAWHDVHIFADGTGREDVSDVWFCPKCKRVF